MLTSNAFTFRKPGSRHRAGKRVQAKRAQFMMRQQEALDRATRVTDDTFPALLRQDDCVVMELIQAVEDMVDDVGGDIIWPADKEYRM